MNDTRSPRLSPPSETEPGEATLRDKLWRIVFLSDTRAGRAFDVALLWAIGISVLIVMLESVESLRLQHGAALRMAEWGFTIVFTIEYLLRLWAVRQRARYALSFFGIVDLLACLPTYLELLFAGSHYLMMLRVLRLLRMFRVLKMVHHIGEAGVLLAALRASRAKIAVFLFSVLVLVCVEGTVMYLLESVSNEGFANIPQSIYWAIVTMTTVGYGDITPVTLLGKLMASIVMLTGFSIIAVPTGVVTVEISREMAARGDGRSCPECGWTQHDRLARFCHQCGTKLET